MKTSLLGLSNLILIKKGIGFLTGALFFILLGRYRKCKLLSRLLGDSWFKFRAD